MPVTAACLFLRGAHTGEIRVFFQSVQRTENCRQDRCDTDGRIEIIRRSPQVTARLEGQLEVLRTECCGRRRPTHRPVAAAPPPPTVTATKKTKTIEDELEPVPDFNVQQQLQLQEPGL